jgi:hypothetical protein
MAQQLARPAIMNTERKKPRALQPGAFCMLKTHETHNPSRTKTLPITYLNARL